MLIIECISCTTSVHLILNTIQPNDAFIWFCTLVFIFPRFYYITFPPNTYENAFFMEILGLEFYFLMFFLWNGMVELYFPLDKISSMNEICHRIGMLLLDIK